MPGQEEEGSRLFFGSLFLFLAAFITLRAAGVKDSPSLKLENAKILPGGLIAHGLPKLEFTLLLGL